MLKNVLKAGRSLERLDFIEGYPPHLLIDDLSIFYMSRIAIFKQSAHVLDIEESIRDHFQRTPLTSRGEPVTHYRFADSKAEPGIQLSDVVVGLLGKMHTYFTETAADEIAADRAGLTGTNLQNAELLRDLISTSHEANLAFLHHVSSMHDLDKLDLFLRFHDGAHAGSPTLGRMPANCLSTGRLKSAFESVEFTFHPAHFGQVIHRCKVLIRVALTLRSLGEVVQYQRIDRSGPGCRVDDLHVRQNGMGVPMAADAFDDNVAPRQPVRKKGLLSLLRRCRPVEWRGDRVSRRRRRVRGFQPSGSGLCFMRAWRIAGRVVPRKSGRDG